ncbi:helix-turn-helix domain-containing protein [Rhodococcus sp. A14]|uniref:helix-turn-helix domain-containing protein n=1 Tax=Rhodococcus sp. A14 TaxID=1194106 RepID=UPI00141DA7A0|nr:hypothetical protein [Rhodococcus sp. A14]
MGTNPDGTRLYASVPMTLARDGQLTAAARSVAIYVWSHDEKFSQSRNDIAEKLGMSVNTVGKALADLQAHGWMVREVHGRGSETWHLQMSNTPFTPDRIRALGGARLDQKLIQSEGTGSETDLPTRSETDLPTRSETDLHRSRRRSAPEVHFISSASTDQDETGHESRSLAVEGSEPTAENRPAKSRQAEPDPEPASAGATEAPEENRPIGLHSLTASAPVGVDTDPFASEPAWRAEAAASEERAARQLEPARHRIADPFAS